MKTPPRVSFHGIPVAADIEALCHEEIAKLERYHERITSCRVVLEEATHRHHKANPLAVHVHLGLPGHDIDVRHEPALGQGAEEPAVTVRAAFAAARRRLQDFAQRRQERTRHPEQPQA